MTATTLTGPRPRGEMPVLRILAYLAALLAVLPLIAIVGLAISRPSEASIPLPLILRYARDTALLAVMVAVGAGVLGSLAAWLVVMHRFPGRGLFSWALALPLAAPAFALAYGYTDLLDVAGPVQTWGRETFGAGFPTIQARSLPGAAMVLSFAFYPYVYLTARSAFVTQSVCALEAARTLGAGAVGTFWRVALPLARPAIAAGVALALMETLADYGAVNFLGVQTLTTGVVRYRTILGEPGSAARLSLVLLAAATVLLWAERSGRQGQSYGAASTRWRTLTDIPLRGLKGWGATLFCTLLLTFALLLPAGWLGYRGLAALPETERLLRAAGVSFGLAAAGAVVTVGLAALIGFGARKGHWAQRLASLGYATPGAVIAVGLLVPASVIWRGGFGVSVAASLVLLLYAYSARLMASALGPIEAGLARITPSMDRAARTLGETEAGALARVHAPLSRGALWTAGLLVFVDILKELPATLILRPFNFDTLAVLADYYASDERLAQAAWPALTIVLVAALPTALLSSKVMRSRPGAAS